MSSEAPVWAVIAAAGSGSRMQQELPKQYLAFHVTASVVSAWAQTRAPIFSRTPRARPRYPSKISF